MKKTGLVIGCIICIAFGLIGQSAMILVKGGPFQMGSEAGDTDEKPVHTIVLANFYLAKTETTYAEFEAFVSETKYQTDAERGTGSYVWDSLGWHIREGVNWRHDERGRPTSKAPNRPVIHVSWNDAAHYCNWLSKADGFVPAYDFLGDTTRFNPAANGYRLPSEAEWEYAAWAGGAEPDKLDQQAWYAGNSVHGAKTVGQKKANALGFYDLSGNVWEWCQDWYDKRFYQKNTEGTYHFGPPKGQEKSLRGGSWNNNSKHCRITNRTSRYPDFRDGSIGFRIARHAKN